MHPGSAAAWSQAGTQRRPGVRGGQTSLVVVLMVMQHRPAFDKTGAQLVLLSTCVQAACMRPCCPRKHSCALGGGGGGRLSFAMHKCQQAGTQKLPGVRGRQKGLVVVVVVQHRPAFDTTGVQHIGWRTLASASALAFCLVLCVFLPITTPLRHDRGTA